MTNMHFGGITTTIYSDAFVMKRKVMQESTCQKEKRAMKTKGQDIKG
jgi:hypothetical protein